MSNPAPAPAQGALLGSGKPSSTAGLNALMRAVDHRLPADRRLADDPYAKLIASRAPRYKYYVKSPLTARLALGAFDKVFGGFLAEILLRGRYLNEVLEESYASGVRQLVLVGAGYDSTALRHPHLTDLKVFEVDHPATQGAKRKIFAAAKVETPSVTYVPVDLESTSLAASLPPAGFDPSAPTLFAWIGVSYYLRRPSFDRALADLASLCAPGSRVMWDYLDPSVVDGTSRYFSAKFAARIVAKRGEPYILGLTPAQAADAASFAGFKTVESLRVPDLVRRYGGRKPYAADSDFMGVALLEKL
jgi:methyltransferase (TIGR00027 family)